MRMLLLRIHTDGVKNVNARALFSLWELAMADWLLTPAYWESNG